MCIVLNLFKKQSDGAAFELYEYFLSFVYFMNFFTVGHMDMKYAKEQAPFYEWFSNSLLQPLLILVGLAGYSICMPISLRGQGNIFAYPMYSDQVSLDLFTTGTWLGVFVVASIARNTLNKEFDATAFKWIAGKGLNLSFYTYLSHMPFVLISAHATRTFNLTFSIILTLVGTYAMVASTYILSYAARGRLQAINITFNVALRLGGDAFNSVMYRLAKVPRASSKDSGYLPEPSQFEETGSTPYGF